MESDEDYAKVLSSASWETVALKASVGYQEY